MSVKKNNSQFREEEIVILRRWDKKNGVWIENSYPKVGGRLRMAHEQNESLSITTEVIRYDESIAVVSAIVETVRGQYNGLGMASQDRDKSIAPAILELAETRSIARALRFAGYGVEYCSAEEISHLENDNDIHPDNHEEGNGNNGAPSNGSGHTEEDDSSPSSPKTNKKNGSNGGNGNGKSNGVNGSGRITNKQMGFIINLGKGIGLNSKGLDEESLAVHGVKLSHLTIKEASSFIEYLQHEKTGR